MRFNEKEMAYLASLPTAHMEGRLSHQSPGFREVFRERWFKLKGNLLFYYRVNDMGGIYEDEPAGMFVIERTKVQCEPLSLDGSFVFSLVFTEESDKKHLFSGTTQKQCLQWVDALRGASIEQLKSQITLLKLKLDILSNKHKPRLQSKNAKKIASSDKMFGNLIDL